jgi:hypothetical protein
MSNNLLKWKFNEQKYFVMINSKATCGGAMAQKATIYTLFRIVNEKVMIVREFVICRAVAAGKVFCIFLLCFWFALIYLIKIQKKISREWLEDKGGGFSQYKC